MRDFSPVFKAISEEIRASYTLAYYPPEGSRKDGRDHQIRIEVNRPNAKREGLTPGEINDQVSRLLGGSMLGELREGEATVDLVMRLPETWRTWPDKIGDLLIQDRKSTRLNSSH